MSQYHPPMKEIPAVVFTSAGWIRGTFHVPQLHGFLDFLSRSEFLKLTDVTLPYQKRHLDFFGLRRSEALMIIPDCPESLLGLPKPTGASRNVPLHLLLSRGCISGVMPLDADIRMSDALTKESKFVLLRDCVLGPSPDVTSTPGSESRFPRVLMNLMAVIGASEESFSA